jgi:nitroreductase
MDAIEALKTRRSVRHYRPEPVPRELLEELVDCGRLAATGRGEQPWEFVVITERATREKLASLASYGKFIAAAGACIAVFCKDTTYYLEDGAAATQNLLVAARACGLGSCWVAGDKKPYAEEVRRLLGAPDGYRLVSLIAVGQPAEEPTPKKRLLAEVLHWERF